MEKWIMDNKTLSVETGGSPSPSSEASPLGDALPGVSTFSHQRNNEPMEQREEKPNLFGLSRVATEVDEIK